MKMMKNESNCVEWLKSHNHNLQSQAEMTMQVAYYSKFSELEIHIVGSCVSGLKKIAERILKKTCLH